MAHVIRSASNDQSRSVRASCCCSHSIVRWNLSCKRDRVTNVSVISALILKCVSRVLPLQLLLGGGHSGSFPFQGFVTLVGVGAVNGDDSGEK